MKYIGSKVSSVNDIISFIHSYMLIHNINTYIEPFVDGANIIANVQASKKFGYNSNKYIIAMFRYLQNGGELPETISSEQYADCKAHYKIKDNLYADWYIGAVGLLAGNNGKFFDKAPNNKNYECSRNELVKQMGGLIDATFEVMEYTQIAIKESLIYCDPHYNGHKAFNYKEFWDIVRGWSANNIVLISGQSAPDDFDIIWEKEDKKEKLFIHKHINIDRQGENKYDF